MAITANRELNRYVDQELRSFDVAESERIYKGAIVGINRVTGFARNLIAGDSFAGIAYEEVDNSGGADGDLSIRLYTQGDFILPINLAAAELVGHLAYAVDNESGTLSPTSGGSAMGTFIALVGTNLGIVRIAPFISTLVEKEIQIPLTSSTSAATTHQVALTQRAIRVLQVQVRFTTPPDQGFLDVGTTTADPDEVVSNFNLASLTADTTTSLTLASRDVAKNLRILAVVGQASSTAGVGGILSMRYVELP